MEDVASKMRAMEELATKIKDIQRKDPNGKSGWIKYVEQHGDNLRDPNKHSTDFLQYFVDQYEAGAYVHELPEGEAAAPKGLAELIKEGQRNAPSFKAAWAAFQEKQGQRMHDPMKASKDNVISFLEFVSQQTIMALGGGGLGSSDEGKSDHRGGGKGGRGMDKGCGGTMGNGCYGAGWDGAPMDMGMGMGASGWGGKGGCDWDGMGKGGGDWGGMYKGGGDDWGMDTGGGCEWAGYGGSPPPPPPRGGGGYCDGDRGGCKGGGKGKGDKGGYKGDYGQGGGDRDMKRQKVSTGDPEKDQAVDRVKAFQRSGDEQRETWWNFCDQQASANRDPARYDTSVLMGFLQRVGA